MSTLLSACLNRYKDSLVSFKICNLLVFSVLIVLSMNMYAEQEFQTKQELWDAMSVDVDHWGDGLNYPVDEGIKETVIVFNLMGIETTASCEGHLDRGLSYPWIDMQTHSPEIRGMMNEYFDVQEQENNEETLLEMKYPDKTYNELLKIPEAEKLLGLYDKRHFLRKAVEERQMQCLEPLNQLLNQFYENRTVSYDNMLVVSDVSWGCDARLHSIGAYRQIIRSEEERSFKLMEYQEEMKAFTAFLKQKFMNAIKD